MAIKTVELGGTDWVQEILEAVDLNDTFDELFALSVELDYSIPPIGSIIPWHQALGVGTVPFGWGLCNGSLIEDADSPLNGQNLRNLNGTTDTNKLFIATGTTSGSTGGVDTHSHGFNTTCRADPYHANESPVASTSSNSALPPYFEVNFIQRYK